jgi:hypothetical protein
MLRKLKKVMNSSNGELKRMMVRPTTTKIKEQKEIDALTEAFKHMGGKVTVIESNETQTEHYKAQESRQRYK